MAQAVRISRNGTVNPHNHTRAHTALCDAIRQYLDAVEAKTGKGVLDADQKKIKAEIIDAGGIYIEARSVDDVHDRLHSEGLVLQLLLR